MYGCMAAIQSLGYILALPRAGQTKAANKCASPTAYFFTPSHAPSTCRNWMLPVQNWLQKGLSLDMWLGNPLQPT